MARVPVSNGRSVALQPLPSARLQPAALRGGMIAAGESIQQFGAWAHSYAEEQERLDLSLDQTAVREVDTETMKRMREDLWTGDDAFYKKEGFDALNAREGAETRINDLREEMLGRLTTERQRKLFGRIFEQRAGQELEGIARHVQGQVRVEEKRAGEARIQESANDAVTYFADPVRRETAIATALSEVRAQADAGGWDPATLKRTEERVRSSVYSRAITSMVDRGEIEAGHAALEASRQFLDPDEEAALDAGLRGPLLDREAEGVVDLLLGTDPAPVAQTVAARGAGNVAERMVHITMNVGEGTGGRETWPAGHPKAGQPIVSPKGARGSMQVMPGTNTAPGFGVRPAQDNTPEERARVGRDYLAAMMRRYGNDPAKAWAAYNAGPGALDNAIAKYGEDWLAHMTAETRGYVARSMAALGGRGAGAPVQQAPREHNMTELLSRLDEMNLPFDVEQRVRQRLTQRVALDEQLLARDREDAAEDAYAVAEGLGDSFTSINQIPMNVRRRMTPQQRLQFEAMAKSNLHESRETDWAAYARYADMATNDPRGFAALNPAEIRNNLGDTEFKEVIGWRQSVQGALAGKGKDENLTTHERIRSVTNPLLEAAGIFAPPAPGAQANQGERDRKNAQRAQHAQRVGLFQRRVSEDVAILQSRLPKGTKVSDDQIREIADRQLLRAWEESTEAGGEARQIYRFERTGPNLKVTIPASAAEEIRARFRARWNRDPDASEVRDIYLYGPRGGR